MIRYFIRRSRGEEFQAIASPPEGEVWIRGDHVDDADLQMLSKTYTLDINILRDVLDAHELPRVEKKNDGTYVFVRTIQRDKHGRASTAPVLLAVRGSVFATLSSRETPSTASTHQSVAQHLDDSVGLLLATFVSILSDYEFLMQHTAQNIHDTGRRLRSHEVTNDDFIRFVTVEDNLNEYKMNLAAMLVVAERLRTEYGNGHTEAIDDILLYIRQLLVAIESYSQSVLSIRNAYGTIANNVLNMRMKTLTVLTVLIALPNVVYGMYGMNVGLPFQHEQWVYFVILLFSLAIVFLVFAIGRKRGIF
ncbi:MAG TPA: CorA family divalent cation transporter [Candidatus Saccharimonadales bacterium]|nr:CorA family divalent cation transporter [Candidatus Saccharimonadales bacterium]